MSRRGKKVEKTKRTPKKQEQIFKNKTKRMKDY